MKILVKVFINILLLLLSGKVLSQEFTNEAIENFYFDAVVFQGETSNIGRVDVLLLVPYQTLNFIKSGNVFGASYNIEIIITDTNGTTIDSKRMDKTLREEEYFITRGGTGKFDYSQSIFTLKPGKYRINSKISDKFSKQIWEKNRIVTVLDFGEFDFAISGILLLSSVEEISGKFKITPHISDNIGNLSNGFFAFFESYKHKFESDSVDYVWEIFNSKNELIAYSDRITKSNDKAVKRNFLSIPKIDEMTIGTYLLRITALERDTVDYKSGKILAITQRSINFIRTIGSNVLADINIAIKQLRYVAYQTDIDFINEGATSGEKQKRFEAFWKKIDPSPGTDRNEAFEEYYSRISYANSSFKSFQEGWLTDKGMVYIIFGPPYTSEKQNNYNDGRIYERWSYMNNREFIFVDNSGFGDFRMVRPMSITEKYRYLK